jgi:Flp pilus assembly protein TadG
MNDSYRINRLTTRAAAQSAHRLGSRFRCEDGQALVELALVLPVLLIVLLGIVDFGRATNYWNDENQIAEAAARFVAVGATPTWTNFPTTGSCTQPSNLQTLVAYEACLDSPELQNGVSGNGVQMPGAAVTVCYPQNAPGQPVTVKVSATYNWLPIPKVLGGNTPLTATTLNGTATMRLESQLPTGSWIPASSC